MNVGMRQLKNETSRIVRRAQAGEEIVVTDRGKPVARILPLQPPIVPKHIQDLIDQGLIDYRNPGPIKGIKPMKLLPGKKSLVDYVREQRR